MGTETAATILVVDDNPAGRYATSRVLRANGFAVLEAGTGEEGVALAAGADLIVLDVQLPDINGFEVCRRIRSAHSTSRTPVIHLSATFVKDTDKVEGLDAGADGYLTHPVEPPVLIATVNAFLRARRAEDEMRKSEAKFKAMFDQASSGILLISTDQVFLEANPRMCSILGRTREQIIGRHISSFIPASFEHDSKAIVSEIEARRTWRGTFPVIRSDGSHVELEWSIADFTLPEVRLAIVNDVTDRKAYEAERDRLLAAERAAHEDAERANRIKDEFLATLSHELRTPLNAIVGWAQILKNGNPTAAEVTEGIDAIGRNAAAQTQLISDLLDVARITSGKLRLDVRPYDPAAVMRAALETMLPAIHAKKIHLISELAGDSSPVQGDPDRIQQVIWNLVNNAVKFTPEGGTIRATFARDMQQLTFSVADNGQGIQPDFLPHIFERFRQQNAGTRRNQGGLGLGLAIVKHLAEMHGGSIEAHSEGKAKGAAFVVRLPVVVAPAVRSEAEPQYDKPDQRPAPAPRTTETSLEGIDVLIVEDDPDARKVIRRLLSAAGASVREAPDVQTALVLVAKHSPDVLISDVGMPDEDGYDLLRQIRERQAGARFLPAIALTAFARHEDRQRAEEAGFQTHLSKPVEANKLLATVAELAGVADRSAHAVTETE